MKTVKPVLRMMLLTLAGSTLTGELRAADPLFTPQQQRYLRQFQISLEARPANPNQADNYLQAVQANLKTLLSTNTTPAGETTNALAATLVRGYVDGQIGVEQSVGLSKELSRVLSLREITPRDTFQFVRIIDPLVQGTNLTGPEKLRLYSDALRVIKSAPTYLPR